MKNLIIFGVIIVIIIIAALYMSGYTFEAVGQEWMTIDFCDTVEECKQEFRDNGATEQQIDNLEFTCNEVCKVRG